MLVFVKSVTMIINIKKHDQNEQIILSIFKRINKTEHEICNSRFLVRKYGPTPEL